MFVCVMLLSGVFVLVSHGDMAFGVTGLFAVLLLCHWKQRETFESYFFLC